MLGKFQGCLIGCAVGDAVGSPVEAQGAEVCQNYIDSNVRPQTLDFVRREQGRHEFGQYTDDTQLMRELAISLVEKESFDPAHFARRLAHLFRDTIVVGYGRATKQSVDRLLRGTPWTKSGSLPPSAGNGSAMRVAPIGLFYRNDFKALEEASHNQGIITHADPRCSAGSYAMALAVAFAATSQEPPTKWWGDLGILVGAVDQEFGRNILLLLRMLKDSDENALKEIQRLSSSTFMENDWKGISPYVVPSVLWSLYSFLKTPGDYWETICTAIWPGGDVDTTAAMAGAISGAYNGLEAIPKDVALMVNDYGSWGFQELCDLSAQLLEYSPQEK